MMRLLVREDTAAIDQHLEFAVGKFHLRQDPVFRLEFALKAPGQASFVGSNQAAVNLDLEVLVHSFHFSDRCGETIPTPSQQ